MKSKRICDARSLRRLEDLAEEFDGLSVTTNLLPAERRRAQADLRALRLAIAELKAARAEPTR